MVGLATDVNEFHALVERYFAEQSLSVIDFEFAEPLHERQLRFQVPTPILELADGLHDGHQIAHDTFFVYETDDE